MPTTTSPLPKEVEDWLNIRMLGEPYAEMVEEDGRRFIRRGYTFNGKKYYEKEVQLKTNEQILDEMQFVDDQGKPIKNYTLHEMIEMAKNSEYGCVWYSDKGPIQITKEGELKPI